MPVEPVPLRDQPMNIGHRQLIVTMNARLVLDAAYSVLRQVLPLDGEHLHHHRERNVGALVDAIVVAAARLLCDAHHLEPRSVQQDPLAQRRPSGEEQLRGLLPQHHNVPPVAQVIGVDHPPLGNRKRTDVRIVGIYALYRTAGRRVLADLLNGLVLYDRRNGSYRRQLAHGLGIGEGHVVRPHAGVLAGDGRNIAAREEDHIVAERRHLAPLPGSEALT